MSETHSPEVKLIHSEHIWKATVQTLEIQDKKMENEAVLLGQDFKKSFGAATGFLCPHGKSMTGTDFKRGWVSSLEGEVFLNFLL